MNLNELLKCFYELTDVPARYYRGNTVLARFGETALSLPFEEDILEQFRASGERFCYQVTPEVLLYGFLCLKELEAYLFLGPVSLEHDLHQQIQYLSQAYHCPVNQALWDHCQRISRLSLQDFLACLQTVYLAAFREGFCEKADMIYLLSRHIPNQEHNPDMDMSIIRNQTVERQLLSCIEHGKIDEIRRLLKYDVQGSDFPSYDLSLLRSYRSVFIASTALCSRAAIRGGMNYDAAISTSDHYIQKVEKLTTPAAIDAEFNRMILYYTEQVAAVCDFSDSSALVKKTTSYIRAHLMEKLTVNDIADALHQNPSYLSHHFKNHTGFSISSYIVQEKINEAKRLLFDSELSLLEIAANLGFSSQQYFQSVFKKEAGCTPTEFRNKKEHT